MHKKLRVAILCGGQSAEHVISLQSAINVYHALDKNKFDISLIAIDPKGRWHLANEQQLLSSGDWPKIPAELENAQSVAMIPGNHTTAFLNRSAPQTLDSIDVVLPILHGTFGEDGSAQGLLKLANIPYVGSGILGSAIGMDKDVAKRLLRDAQIPVAPFLVFRRDAAKTLTYQSVVAELGQPFFVKPANAGSSIGITKVHSENEFKKAVDDALLYDKKIIIEQSIKGREIECAVLGNENPKASILGEVIPHHEFYSYEAKYLDDNGASLHIPAKLPAHLVPKIQALAIQVFQTLECTGMARVDFFVDDNENIFVNEINTIPGFTKISMYPKLWEASGISYSELIERLIELAIENFDREATLNCTP